MSKGIKAIIFDLGRVLVDYDMDRYYKGLEPFSDLSFRDIKNELDYSDLSRDYTTGKISVKDFYKKTIDKINAKNLSFDEFKEIRKRIFVAPNEEIEDVLKLINPEIKIVLLSNLDEIFWEVSRENSKILRKFFSDDERLVLSFKVGFKKADSRIFRKAIKKSGCLVDECLFIDDQEKNLRPFRLLGGKTIQYNCQKNSISELKKTLDNYKVLI